MKSLEKLFQYRLKELRGEQTQKYVADKIGITEVSLSRYENGQRKPNLDIIYKIAKYYNVSADYLIGLDNQISDYEILKRKYEKLQDKFNQIVNIIKEEVEDTNNETT